MTIDIRTRMEILEPDECWALLRRAEVGRLAVTIMEQPDIFPVNFITDHGSIVFRTAEGTKLAASVLGKAVAFEVDGYDADDGVAWSIVAKGPAGRSSACTSSSTPLTSPCSHGTPAPSRASSASFPWRSRAGGSR